MALSQTSLESTESTLNSSATSTSSDHKDDEKLSIHSLSDVEPIESQKDKIEHHVEEAEPYPDPESPPLTKTTSRVLERVLSRITTRSLPEPPPPPDGGSKAWTQVAMGWLVIFTTWGWVNSYGAFQTYYTLNLDVAPSTISWIGAVQNFLTFFLGAFSGRLLDAGYFLPTLVTGAVIQVVGMFLMSISTKFWSLMLTQGVMTGIGGGIFFTPAVGLMGTYFSKRRAVAIGLSTTGNSAGGIIYPVLVQQLLPKIGFAWTVRVLGFLNLACLALVIAFMRPRLPPRKSGPLIDVTAFKEAPYVLFVLGSFFFVWAVYYTFYYLASYGNEILGLPFTTSTAIVILINGAGMPCRIIPPFFADRYGPLTVLVPVQCILAIVSFCWLGVHSKGGLWAYTAVYGMAAAAFQCLMPSTVASLTPRLDMFGTRLGMMFSFLSIAALTGPPLGGALQSHGREWLGATLWAAASTTLAAGLVTAARVSKGGWKIEGKC